MSPRHTISLALSVTMVNGECVEAMTMTKRTYTAAEDRALARLESEDIIHFDTISGAVELNTLRDLAKRGILRFARLPNAICGYTLMSRSFIRGVV